MGLCKCPKRCVTNQFCFEHRVNVCEHCMVTNHPKCIVQSYLQWLQDSDYNPICEICTKTLGDEECIRLTCYHVYHWSCLESEFRSLPRTTAPAGYSCPSCRAPLFPAPNLVSYVADVLRERLAAVNWARAGLGLPLLSEDQDMKASESRSSPATSPSQYGAPGYGSASAGPLRTGPVGASDDESHVRASAGPPYSVVQVQEDNAYDAAFNNRNDAYQANQAPRKSFGVKYPSQTSSTSNYDHDEDKYKRKSALEWLSRWWKNTLPPARSRRSTGHVNRRYTMGIILLIIVIITMVIILSKIGRSAIEDDPSFLPQNNPNVHLKREIDA